MWGVFCYFFKYFSCFFILFSSGTQFAHTQRHLILYQKSLTILIIFSQYFSLCSSDGTVSIDLPSDSLVLMLSSSNEFINYWTFNPTVFIWFFFIFFILFLFIWLDCQFTHSEHISFKMAIYIDSHRPIYGPRNHIESLIVSKKLVLN